MGFFKKIGSRLKKRKSSRPRVTTRKKTTTRKKPGGVRGAISRFKSGSAKRKSVSSRAKKSSLGSRLKKFKSKNRGGLKRLGSKLKRSIRKRR